MYYNANQQWQQVRTPTQFNNKQQAQVYMQQMQHRPCSMTTNQIPQYLPISSNSSVYQPPHSQYQRGQPQLRMANSQYFQMPEKFKPMWSQIDYHQVPSLSLTQLQQNRMFRGQIQSYTQKFDDDEFVKPQVLNQTQNIQNQQRLVNFEIHATYSKCKLTPDKPQYLPVVVTLNPIEQQQLQQTNITCEIGVDLICVIDISWSMLGVKLQMVQYTLISLLDVMREQDRLCLIEFCGTAKRTTTLRRITNENKKYFRTVINQMTCDDDTCISEGTHLAFKQINERKYKNNVTSVFILSDGQDLNAEKVVTQQLKTQNQVFTIHSFGFGSDADAQMMTKLCNLRGGSFYFVNDVQLLDEFFVDAFGGLISVVAENVELTVSCQQPEPYQGIQISKTYGAMWKPIQQHRQYTISIPQLSEGQRKDYVLELLLPNLDQRIADNQRDVIVLKAQVSLVHAHTKAVEIKQAQLKLQFYNQDQQMPVNTYNIDAAIQYYRVKATETINEARRLCELGDFQKAKEIIHSMSVKIRSNPNLAKAATSILKDLEQTQIACQPHQFMAFGQQQMCQMVSNNMNQQGINALFDQYGRQQQPVNQAVYQNSTQARMVNQVQLSKLTR